jgi:hypothetical protein
VYWWEGDSRENLFMEITNRSDVGTDLKAPVMARGGTATSGYALVRAVGSGDIVVHYDSPHERIVGVSLATGEPEPATLFWVARGASARKAGERARWLSGIRVPLDSFVLVDPPISLDEIRQHQDSLLAIRDEIAQRNQEAVYFPWTPYRSGPIRTSQSYLVKLPQAAVDLFPRLRSSISSVEASRAGALELPSEVQDAEEKLADVAGKLRLRSGQGYQLDQAVKSAVEAHAMNVAIAHFGGSANVDDVHGTESYDLRYTSDGIEKHVEVKGTTTLGDQVVLTRKEVEHARTYPHVVLFILADIVVTRDEEGNVTASQGRERMFDPWRLDDGTLTPIGFRYEVPT